MEIEITEISTIYGVFKLAQVDEKLYRVLLPAKSENLRNSLRKIGLLGKING